MWEVTGAKAHELRDNSLWKPEHAETLHRIVDQRHWQRSMLPKTARQPTSRGRGGVTGGRKKGGHDGGDRPFWGRRTEGRKDSESDTQTAETSPAERSATPSAKNSTPWSDSSHPSQGCMVASGTARASHSTRPTRFCRTLNPFLSCVHIECIL